MPARPRHIVAIGGGAFSAAPENLALDRYLLGLTRRTRPAVCLIPTANAESNDTIAKFFDVYTRLGATPSVLRLFQRTPDVRERLLSQDVIYVGGGNTKSMLAVWRDWGLPAILREAWRRGIVLAGVSAGAICWFDQGVTDSWADELAIIDGLGFLRGTACPHYDSEEERRPSVHHFVEAGTVPSVLALDDGAAAHFVGTRLHQVLSWRPEATGYRVSRTRGILTDAALPCVTLRPYRPRR